MVKEREKLHFGELLKAFWGSSDTQEIPEIEDALKEETLTDEQKKELRKALSEVQKMENSISSTNTSKTKNKKMMSVKNEVNLNIPKEKIESQKQLEDDGREM